MSFAYSGRAAAAAAIDRPTTWPTWWTIPAAVWFSPGIPPTWTVPTPPQAWPPGYPIVTPANNAIEITGRDFIRGDSTTVDFAITRDAAPTTALNGQLIYLFAAVGGTLKQIRLVGGAYADGLLVVINDSSFTGTYQVNLTAGDDGGTLTWYAAIVTIQTVVSDSAECAIAATAPLANFGAHGTFPANSSFVTPWGTVSASNTTLTHPITGYVMSWQHFSTDETIAKATSPVGTGLPAGVYTWFGDNSASGFTGMGWRTNPTGGAFRVNGVLVNSYAMTSGVPITLSAA